MYWHISYDYHIIMINDVMMYNIYLRNMYTSTCISVYLLYFDVFYIATLQNRGHWYPPLWFFLDPHGRDAEGEHLDPDL